jgi:hypothetical protein
VILQWNFVTQIIAFYLKGALLLKNTMQHISDTHIKPDNIIRGGRISSPKLRQSLKVARDFEGLEEEVNRYDLLLLVKRVGRLSGFSPRMIALLDYYMSFTKDIDWEQGSSPIIYQSLSKTALDLGVSERQIQRLEKALFDIGALTWNDSGNHRRYGQRDPESGEIIYAFGVDLTPLAYLKGALAEKLKEKQERDALWMELKRQISWHRRQIRSVILEAESRGDEKTSLALEEKYEAIAHPIRAHMEITSLNKLLDKHKELFNEAIVNDDLSDNKDQMLQKESCSDDNRVVHYKYTIQQQSDKSDTSKAQLLSLQRRRNAALEDKKGAIALKEEPDKDNNPSILAGLQHITLKQASMASSDRLKAYLPIHLDGLSWPQFIEGCYRLRVDLEISQSSWGRACQVLGRSGAAICVLLTDNACYREEDPVRKPAAYFNAMIKRAEEGELHLHQSIFGILKT